VSEHVKPLISHAANNGFPSDHALFTMTITAITYYFSKKTAAVMLVLTIIIGVARVLALVHSPLDIGAGWVIGVIGAVAGYYGMLAIDRKYLNKSGQSVPIE
jgi:undecaprenyl-diphosphatase